ncbi:MAG TPA: ABC transporter substrate-binding protein [Dongiaceae bacterium]|jgi:peptide/nickel transport system substrate-binding protein
MHEFDAQNPEIRSAVNRRSFLGQTLSAGALTLTGCGKNGDEAGSETVVDATPKRGGSLKIGIAGGSPNDSLDPRTYTDTMIFNVAFAIMNQVVEIDENNDPQPSLFKSWEASEGATKWVFKVRSGVTFHNGKTLEPEDIVYSINLHRGPDTKSGAADGLKSLVGLKVTDKDEITMTLAEGDADFLYPLSDYHVLVVPKDFKDWSKPVGTGAFTFESFNPGVSATAKRYPDYWNSHRGFVDDVTFTCINDTAARMNAIMSGKVDIIHRVDTATVDLLKRVRNVQLVMARGGYHAIYAARCDTAPFSDPNLRKALKYAIDREQLLRFLFNGYGAIGNDNPIPVSDPYFNKDLEATVYDPDKAKFYFGKANVDVPLVLSASDAAFNGAVDAALLFQSNAKAAGVKFDVKKEPADSFWKDVWLKVPFCESYWAGRPAATQMFTTAYRSDAVWNDTGFKDPKFDQLLADAKKEIDKDKRRPMIYELQRIVHTDGGAIIPAFKDWVDAIGKRVKGYKPHHMFDLCNGRAAEKVWIAA